MESTQEQRDELVIKWATKQLSKLLEYEEEDAKDLAEYLYSIEDEESFRDYVNDAVDNGKRFQDQFLKKKAQAKNPPKPKAPSKAKTQPSTSSTPNSEQQATTTTNAVSTGHSHGGDNSNAEGEGPSLFFRALAKGTSKSGKKKKKLQYISFLDRDGNVASSDLIPGRHWCECVGGVHELVNNCLQCGRVVCEQEGMGPCMVCGALVVTREYQDLLARNSNKAKKFLSKLLKDTGVDSSIDMELLRKSALYSGGNDVTDTLTQALNRRDMLLDFDENSVKRTRVIDDEADYFSTGNRWMSKDERKKMEKREKKIREAEKEKRRSNTVTLSLAGGKLLLEDDREKNKSKPNIYQQVRAEEEETERSMKSSNKEQEHNPMLGNSFQAPMFNPLLHDTNAIERVTLRKNDASSLIPRAIKVQDLSLEEMADDGICLSMHQPYASLLVHGIKLHEGRCWYSAHRGRLWIAAAAKVPTDEDIASLEEEQKLVRKRDFTFPQSYPTACLLGFVDVVDVLPQEEYREKFPEGGSYSDYVFICTNPHVLVTPFPIKGQHKLWKLDKQVHSNAKKACLPITQ
eukprot:m.82447 g.82447  ORF g.82447 m.82447 type:complete len:573 (-) comp12086_c0_seq1:43-1761(-)